MNSITLTEFKTKEKIITSEVKSEISNKFEGYIELFKENPLKFSDNDIYKFKFEELIDLCDQIDFNSIPYARLTDLIFNHDEVSEFYSKNSNREESGITQILKSKFDSFILENYSSSQTQKHGEEINNIFSDNKCIDVEKTEKDVLKIKIIYKMFEHIELAEAQKMNLYMQQRDELKYITDALHSQNDQLEHQTKLVEDNEKIYNRLISSFISILGIFSAILMGMFGGIKGFTSLFTANKNLIDLTIIAVMGFAMLMMFSFLLLNSISKMTGEKLYESNKSNWWFTRHPTMTFSLSISFFIILLLIFSKYHEVINKTIQINNFWIVVILSLLPLSIFMISSYVTKCKGEKNKSK